MKKIISILLIICTLTLCLASCGGSNNNNTDNTNNDCATTGLHIYDKGKCTGCGLKVFDVLKDYIIKNGKNMNTFYRITLGTLFETENTTLIEYVPENDCISITCCSTIMSHDYSFSLDLTPYVFEDGEYEWSALCMERYCDHPSINGFLDPYKFSRSTNSLSHNSNEDKADDLAKMALRTFKNNMDEYLIDFCKSVGNNITIKDLGFVRYN